MAATAGGRRLAGLGVRHDSLGQFAASGLAAVAVIVLVTGLVTQFGNDSLLYGVAMGLGVAVLAYCFLEPRTGRTMVIFMLYVTLVDGYLKLATNSDAITLGRSVLLLAIVSGMLVRAIARRDLSLPPMTAAVALYTTYVLVQILHPDSIGLLHSLGGLRPHLEAVPLFFVAFSYFRSAQRIRVFFMLLLVVTTINGVVALIQYQLTPEQLASWGPGYRERVLGEGSLSGRVAFNEASGEVKVRPFGLGSDVGFSGILGVLAVPAGLAVLSLRRRGWQRVIAAILSAGTIMALATSQARITVVLAAAAALGYIALSTLSQRRIQLIAGVLVTSAVAWLAVSVISVRTDATVFDRYESIAPNRFLDTAFEYKSETFRLTGEYLTRFPFGAGLGNVGPATNFAGSPKVQLDGESEFNFLLVELGLPGLVFMTGFLLWLVLLAFTRIPRVRDDQVRPLLAAMGAALIAILFGFAGAPVTSGIPIGPFLWIAAGTFAYWLIHVPKLARQAEQRQLFAPR